MLWSWHNCQSEYDPALDSSSIGNSPFEFFVIQIVSALFRTMDCPHALFPMVGASITHLPSDFLQIGVPNLWFDIFPFVLGFLLLSFVIARRAVPFVVVFGLLLETFSICTFITTISSCLAAKGSPNILLYSAISFDLCQFHQCGAAKGSPSSSCWILRSSTYAWNL